MIIPTSTPHPLKRELQENGITLWALRQMLGGRPSESRLSYYLNSRKPMNMVLEARIYEILRQLKYEPCNSNN